MKYLRPHSASLGKRWIAAAVVLCCAQLPTLAHAFSTPGAYIEQPGAGGGGGRWFSGSPAEGFGCDVCHSDESGRAPFPLQVSGLPAAYALGASSEVILAWPEFAARYVQLRGDPMQPLAPDAQVPAMGLVAELVAESGRGSGTIEIDAKGALAPELCEVTRPNLRPRLAARLFQVRAGVEPREIRPDSTGVMRCVSRRLGQRCLIALDSCGAQQVRFRWGAPPTSEGPIWFSAGFVATEAISGSFDNDLVYRVSTPMTQAGTGDSKYAQEISSGCSAGGAARARAPVWAWIALVLCGLLVWRRRRRQPVVPGRSAVLLGLAAWLVACGPEQSSATSAAYPNAGLYTPGSALGASDPTDFPQAAALGNRCVPLRPDDDGDEGSDDGGTDDEPITEGMLTVEYMTKTVDGRYAPKNCSGAWIETPDDRYVVTLELAAGLRRPSLVYFQDHACTEKLGVDVVTGPTRIDHTKKHLAQWRGLDFEGKPVVDGPYRLYIEVTEDDKQPGAFQVFDFVKGPEGFSQEPPLEFDGQLEKVSIKWEPEAP